MLVQKKTSKKKLALYIFIIVVLLGMASYLLYWNFGKNVEEEETEDDIVFTAAGLPPQVKIDFAKGVFENLLFDNLNIHGNLPVKVSEQGRTNPFENPFD